MKICHNRFFLKIFYSFILLISCSFILQCNTRENTSRDEKSFYNTEKFNPFDKVINVQLIKISDKLVFPTIAIGRSSSSSFDDALKMPIYNSGIAHPSIVHIPTGYSGYLYWLAMTPYFGIISKQSSPSSFENPHLFKSNDGINWIDAFDGPLDRPSPFPSSSYWSDVNLVNDNSKLLLYYRGNVLDYNYFGDKQRYTRAIVEIESENGKNWSQKKLVYSTQTKGADNNSNLLSPSFLKVTDNLWYVYDVISSTTQNPIPSGYGNQSKNFVSMRKSNNYKSNFEDISIETICKFNNRPWGENKDPWHLEVLYINQSFFIMLINVGNIGSSSGDTLYLAFSKDGKTFNVYDTPLLTDSYKSTLFLKQHTSNKMTFWLYQSKTLDGSINLYEINITNN